MFSFIEDRTQEVELLKFAKLEAECNKHNIREAEKLEDELKSDGSIHKTRMKQRVTIVNRWKKEQKALKKFFIAHRKEGNKHDNKRYSYRTGITNNRWC